MDKEIYGMLTEIRDIAIETKTKVDGICESNVERDKRIKALEEKPAKRWDGAVSGFIAAIVAAVVSIFTKDIK